ncbi:MAG: tyrosine-type recombinase/integrase [Candidatus Nitrosotalea sp.]|nr:tyrosine-type recombinase/integrase [Candidatus Nitrosotalea sp.]
MKKIHMVTVPDDIHHNRRKYENCKKNIAKWFSKDNSQIALDFLETLRSRTSLKHSRLTIYANQAIALLKIKDDRPIKEWNRKDIEKIISTLKDSSYSSETKILMAIALKKLVHYAKHNEIIDKNNNADNDYDPVVDWVRPTMFKDNHEKIQPKDLLTDEEMLKLIEASKKLGGRYIKRNIAAIYVLFDGAFRPAELLNIKIGNIEFSEDHYRAYTYGKTGPKTLTLVTSMIPVKEWLAEHPKADDSSSYLFYHNNQEGRMSYPYLRKLIKNLQVESGIKKRVWAYLFRHSAITEYVRLLKSPQLVKRYGNWSKNSNMINRYEHLADSDQEDAILKLHGLKKEDESKVSMLFSKICPSCKERNSADKSHCVKCGEIISKKLAQEREAGKQDDMKKIEKKFGSAITELQEAILEQQRKFEEILREKN